MTTETTGCKDRTLIAFTEQNIGSSATRADAERAIARLNAMGYTVEYGDSCDIQDENGILDIDRITDADWARAIA